MAAEPSLCPGLRGKEGEAEKTAMETGPPGRIGAAWVAEEGSSGT
jgi:hypothetical protein